MVELYFFAKVSDIISEQDFDRVMVLVKAQIMALLKKQAPFLGVQCLKFSDFLT